MNLQYIIKSCLCLLVITIAFGCREKNNSSIHPETVADKQLAGVGSNYTNEEHVVRDTPSGPEVLQAAPIKDQIQMEQWRPLIGDLKSALGGIREDAEQTR